MKVGTKQVQVGAPDAQLEQVKQRFALWRKRRRRGERIASALWDAAVGLVEQHGLQRTAQELRVDCARLQQRLARGGGRAQTGEVAARFVELSAPPVFGAAPSYECIVEMENGRGAKMRVELKNLDGLAALSRAFWSAR